MQVCHTCGEWVADGNTCEDCRLEQQERRVRLARQQPQAATTSRLEPTPSAGVEQNGSDMSDASYAATWAYLAAMQVDASAAPSMDCGTDMSTDNDAPDDPLLGRGQFEVPSAQALQRVRRLRDTRNP